MQTATDNLKLLSTCGAPAELGKLGSMLCTH